MKTPPGKSNLPKRKSRKPVCVVPFKNLRIPIYKAATAIRGKVYPAFIAYYYDEKGVRQHLKRSDLEKLKSEVKNKAEAIAKGEVSSVNLTAQQATNWQQVEKIAASIGKSAISIVEEYKTFFLQLRPGVSPQECINYFNAKNHVGFSSKKTQEIVDEMIAAKKADNLSQLHYNDLQKRLKTFATYFDCPFDKILGSDIATWLRNLKKKDNQTPVSIRTRENFRAAIVTLVEFARFQKYIPRDWDEMHGIKSHRALVDVYTFTPEEIAKLITHAPTSEDNGNDSIFFFIVIGAFAGLRTSEILRLDWANVNFEARKIIIDQRTTKKRERRTVPIRDNLYEWLKPFKGKRTGFVMTHHRTFDALTNAIDGYCKKIGVKWKFNGLRSSSISYSVAEGQNLGLVADNHGNSIRKIKTNYLDLKLPEDAKKYYAIVPASSAVVTKLLQNKKKTA